MDLLIMEGLKNKLGRISYAYTARRVSRKKVHMEVLLMVQGHRTAGESVFSTMHELIAVVQCEMKDEKQNCP